jgi:thymidylate synthase
MSNWIETQYLHLLEDILEKGVEKKDRTGTGTLSIFGRQIRHNMKDGFPLLTTKKMAWKTMVTELIWFLRGDTNIKYLVDNNCHIWNGDAYKNWCRQFDVDPNNFDAEELVKGHGDQCWGYPILDHVKPTSKEYKRGQINAYLEGKADKPFFYLTQEEFINKIKTDDEFAKKWGELGPVYGKQWRNWGGELVTKRIKEEGKFPVSQNVIEGQIDQIANLISELKTNPDSRRLMVNAYNIGELDQMVLPPCHYGFQVYTRELSYEERKEILYSKFRKGPIIVNGESYIECAPTDINFEFFNIPTRAISLMWVQRSVDSALGWPYNVSSYSLLLMMLAKQVNMVPDEVICSLGDCHIYLNHIDGVKEQLTRESYPLPNVRLSERAVNDISEYTLDDIVLENYQSHPKIYFPLSN